MTERKSRVLVVMGQATEEYSSAFSRLRRWRENSNTKIEDTQRVASKWRRGNGSLEEIYGNFVQTEQSRWKSIDEFLSSEEKSRLVKQQRKVRSYGKKI